MPSSLAPFLKSVRSGLPALLWLFGSATFLSALLLFSVQPMIGKMVLPIMGGTPGAWNTCMAFYQGTLLAGYAWAHLASTRLALHWHCLLQLVILALLFVFLPITIPADLQVPESEGLGPAFWLCRVLVVSAGLPFFVIATMTPTLQRWFSRSSHRLAGDPYFLYSISNAGSLLGLLSYPWIVEPGLSLSQQGRLWATGVVTLAYPGARLHGTSLEPWRGL